MSISIKFNRHALLNFYLFTILSSIILYRGVFMLFLNQKGLNLAQVGLYQTVFFLSNTALEIPTGYVGDRFGRKASIVMGLATLSLYSLLMTLTLPPVSVVGLAVVEALAYTLISGSDSALLYENVKELYGEKVFDRINSRVHSIRTVAVGLGILTGGLISASSWNLLYYLTAGITLSSVFFAIGIRDSHSVRREKTLTVKLNDIHSYITHKKPMYFLLAVLGITLVDGLFIVIFNYNQLTLKHNNISTPVIGVVFAIIYFLNPISYTIASRLSNFSGKTRLIIWGLLVQALALSLFALVHSWLLVAVVIFSSLVPEFIFINYENYVQENIRSELRATLMSTVSMLRSVSAAGLYVLVGIVMEKVDARLVISVCGVVLLCIVLLVIGIIKWRLRRAHPVLQRIAIDEVPLGDFCDDYISRIIAQQLNDTLLLPEGTEHLLSHRLTVVYSQDVLRIEKNRISADDADLEHVFAQLVARLQDKGNARNVFALGIVNYGKYLKNKASFTEVAVGFQDDSICIRVDPRYRKHLLVYLSGLRVSWKKNLQPPVEIKNHRLFKKQIIIRKPNALLQFVLVRNVYLELALYGLRYLDTTSNTTFPEVLRRLLSARHDVRQIPSCLYMFLVFNNKNSVAHQDRLLRRAIRGNLGLSALAARFKNTLSAPDDSPLASEPVSLESHDYSLTLGYDPYHPNREVAQFITQQLRQIGLKVSLVQTDFLRPAWNNDMQLVILNQPTNRQCLNYYTLGYLSPLKLSPEHFKLFYNIISDTIASDNDIDFKNETLQALMHEQVPFVPIARLKSFYLLRPGYEDPYHGL